MRSRPPQDRPSPRALLCGLACVALLGGCATPSSPTSSQRSAVSLPTTFDGRLPGPARPASAPLTPAWWTSFNDPTLDHLISHALEANETLKIADARLRQAQAEETAARAGPKPSVNAVAQYQRQHLPPNDRNKDPLVSQYAITGFEASWDADLFGRVRNLAAAAHADVQAASAARDNASLAVASELASAYFQFRGDQSALAQARRARELQSSKLPWIQRRISAGEANRTDLAEATLRLDSQDADLADLEQRSAHTLHRLSVLAAEPTETLRTALAQPARLDAEPESPAHASPAALLRHRADIRQAERELVAAHAIDQASRADLFPRLTFNGQLSFFAFGWGLGPTLQWDLFDRSRVKAREARAGAQVDEAFARYQRTVSEAVAQVEDALSDLKTARARRDSLKSAAAEAAKLAAYTRRRAQAGLANRIDIADAEISEARTRLALDSQEALVRQAWVGLFRALGGGWSDDSARTVNAPTASSGR